jgi:hypothetical protein
MLGLGGEAGGSLCFLADNAVLNHSPPCNGSSIPVAQAAHRKQTELSFRIFMLSYWLKCMIIDLLFLLQDPLQMSPVL